MAIVPLGGSHHWPEMWHAGFVNNTLDATNTRYAWMCRVPHTGNIDRIAVVAGGTVTTSESIDVRLETLTGAVPSGSLYGASGAGTWGSQTASTPYEIALSAAAAATVDDWIAVVFQWTSTAGSLSIAAANNSLQCPTAYRANYSGGVWTAQTNTLGMLGLRYDDGLYYPVSSFVGPNTGVLTAFNSNSTPDERGLKLALPVGMEVTGFWLQVDADNAADAVLYDDADNVIESRAIATTERPSTSIGLYFVNFAPVELAAGTYRLVVKPTTTSNVTLRVGGIHNAAVRGSFPGGTNICGTSRTNAGAWTDSDTTVYAMGFVVSGIDIPAGGGMIGGRLVR